jgi:hypothetical protein
MYRRFLALTLPLAVSFGLVPAAPASGSPQGVDTVPARADGAKPGRDIVDAAH